MMIAPTITAPIINLISPSDLNQSEFISRFAKVPNDKNKNA